MTSDAIAGTAFPEGLIESQKRVFEQEARKLAAEAEREELKLAAEHRLVALDLSSDRFHRVYQFDNPIVGLTVKICMTQLAEWHRLYPGEDISIVFNSPGGDIIEGFALFDYILYLRNLGHAIHTTSLGMAASMAGVLLQAGTTRTMGRGAWLLLHEGSIGAIGSMGAVEDQLAWVKKMQDRILDIYSDRSIMARADIALHWQRRDWWMSADEALGYGFIDGIGLVRGD
ncbi:hypothetical protein LCGC14_0458030 [marine sediment metagenome]|uniref:Endopeptidase Clp n=1 Tax=marine sediment metagenome TaxID=412755 RepID=A0A0F9SFZ0_9ZZZZ